MKIFRKIKNMCGSATVEAAVGFTAFLFTVFTIMNVVNYCRAQMLVANALDTAAKELSQYSYFYKMSGLNKISNKVGDTYQASSEDVDDIIGTVDGLYQSLGNAKDDAKNVVNQVKDGYEKKDAGELKQSISDAFEGVRNNKDAIKENMDNVQDAFNEVKDDPVYYLKSIALIAGSTSLDMVKSHLIAAPLAKSLFMKHFGSNYNEADEALEKLGIVDGIDGMNFNLSTIFSAKEPEDIHLIVYYNVKLTTFFKGLDLSATFCKESRARAWLAGDNVDFCGTAATPTDENLKSFTDEEMKEFENPTNHDGNPDEKNKESEIDTTNSYWHLEGRSEYGNTNRDHAFFEYFKNTHGNMEQYLDGYINGIKGTTVYSYSDYTEASDLESWLSRTNSSTISTIQSLEERGKENVASGDVRPDGKPIYGLEEAKVYHMVVYVPENIDESKPGETQKMEQVLRESEAQYKAAGYTLTYEIVKAGGNYDYSN